MSKTSAEIDTQPACWRRAVALALAPHVAAELPPDGVETAVVGCGTSYYMAQAYAAAREVGGRGRTDAFAASEFPRGRVYPFVVAISRSGTTSEIESLLAELPQESDTLLLTAVSGSPAAAAARHVIVLEFADEESVVQTRFATTALALLRVSLGHDVLAAADDGTAALTAGLPLAPGADQVTFVGTGWTVGLAAEAALKVREAAQIWAESYPAMEYRHGPISIAASGRAVWPFGPLPPGLAEQIATTGAALVETGGLDPMAALILAQRYAVAEAERKGLDPDRPRSLTRAVILPSTEALA